MARARRSAVGGGLLAAALALTAPRAARSQPAMALPPSAAEPIAKAFARLDLSWHRENVRLDRDHVTTQLCARPDAGGCFTLRLDPPGPGCAGEPMGPFCASFPTGAPAAQVRAAITEVLRDLDPSQIWVRLDQQRTGGPHPTSPAYAGAPRGLRARVAAICGALLFLPVAAGAILGALGRALRRRRVGGAAAAVGALLLPAVIAVVVCVRHPMIGLWDAALEGLLVGAGLLAALHRALAGWAEKLLLAGSTALSLLLLEACARLMLPAPPAFPVGGEPHLGLAAAMRVDSDTAPWDTRSRELVCRVLHGDAYPGILDVRESPRMVAPARFTPRPGARRRVLHVGDSMVYGFGVQPEVTFVARLGQGEPDAEHVNAGIPGVAPNGYLVLLRRWLELAPPDLAVLYLFEGNDVQDLDGPYPCCGWQPLLDEEREGAPLRCPAPVPLDLGSAGWTWLRYNSPPPYLLRALLPGSIAAAHVSGVLVSAGRRRSLVADESEEVRLRHLGVILAAARDALRARSIPLVVVVLPTRNWVDDPHDAPHLAPTLAALAERAGARTLDPSSMLREAARRGEHLFLGDGSDVHFNEAGHARLAAWLRERLPP